MTMTMSMTTTTREPFISGQPYKRLLLSQFTYYWRFVMLVTAITTWEGTPAGIEGVIEGSRLAGPIHESLGARNPRLMRSFAGDDLYRVEYMIDFDSFEACGAFTDAMLGHEWFVQMTASVVAAYPELKNCGTRFAYNTM